MSYGNPKPTLLQSNRSSTDYLPNENLVKEETPMLKPNFNTPKVLLIIATLFSIILVASIFIYTYYDRNRFNQELASFTLPPDGVLKSGQVNPENDGGSSDKKEAQNVVQKPEAPQLLDSKTREALFELLGSDYESKLSKFAAYSHLDLDMFENTYVLENGQTIAEAQAAHKAFALEIEATIAESKALEASTDALIAQVDKLLEGAREDPLHRYVIAHYGDRDSPPTAEELMKDPEYARLYYKQYPVFKEIDEDDELLKEVDDMLKRVEERLNAG